MFNRGHYALVAAVLHGERPLKADQDKLPPTTDFTIDSIARALAQRFEDDNPSFDKGLFLCACGVKSHE